MTATQEQFWSDISRQYDDVVDAQLGRHLRRLIRDRLAREPALGTVVEIGCGSGYFTSTLARKAHEVIATDLAPGMLDVARAELAGVSHVRFQVEDCQRTTFADASCDAAFLGLVLQFADVDATLREMRRILRPGGALIIANHDVFAMGVPQRLLLLARTLYHARRTYGRRMPRVDRRNILSSAQLQARVRDAGFLAVSTEPIRDDAAPIGMPVVYCRALKPGDAGP